MTEPHDPPEAGRRPLAILVVDDSAMMRTMIKRVVTLSEVLITQVHEASNGAEALAVLEAHPVDALFTDLNMPVMSGMELLREIERHERYRHLTRVVVSTDGSAARREEARSLHVRLYVVKPFRPEVMRDVLAEITAGPDAR